MSHQRESAEGASIMEPRLTERMCFQSVLQQHSWMMLSMLDSIGDGLVVTNAAGQFVFFNEAAKQQFGSLPTAEMAIEWMEHSPCYRSDGVTPFPIAERPLTRALQGEAVDSVELLVRQAQMPADLWLSVTARPLMDEEGAARWRSIVMSPNARTRSRNSSLH